MKYNTKGSEPFILFKADGIVFLQDDAIICHRDSIHQQPALRFTKGIIRVCRTNINATCISHQ